MPSQRLSGVQYFPATPFDEDGDVNFELLRDRVTEVTGRADIAATVALGSAGEGPYLTKEERKDVAEVVTDELDGDSPVYVGTHAVSTKEAVELSVHAEEVGADGVFVNAHSYFPLNPDEILQHYERINDAISIDILAYDNPGVAGTKYHPELVEKITDLENVGNFKSATPDLELFRHFVLDFQDRVSVSAAFPHMFEKIAFGADGWASPIVNIYPEASVAFFNTLSEGNLTEAREMYHEWMPLLKFFETENYAVTIKTILQLEGYDVGPPRSPLRPMNEDKRTELQDIVETLDLGSY